MKNVEQLHFDDLTKDDIYYSIYYLNLLGFDVEKNTTLDLFTSMMELKKLAIQDKTTIKTMYLKEKNSTLN